MNKEEYEKHIIHIYIKNIPQNKLITTLKTWIMAVFSFSVLISFVVINGINNIVLLSSKTTQPNIIFGIIFMSLFMFMWIILSEMEIFSTYKLMKTIQNKELVKE